MRNERDWERGELSTVLCGERLKSQGKCPRIQLQISNFGRTKLMSAALIKKKLRQKTRTKKKV